MTLEKDYEGTVDNSNNINNEEVNVENNAYQNNTELTGQGAQVVHCNVLNCAHNKNGQCFAGGIEVSTDHAWPTATSSVGTACVSFKPKDESIYHPDTV